MEKNYISKYQPTCFYVTFYKKQYGVCVNIKDIDRAEEIIKEGLEKNKECIAELKREWEEELNREVIV